MNCTICKNPVTLSPSAKERARKHGGQAKVLKCADCGKVDKEVAFHYEDADAVDFDFADIPLCSDCYEEACYNV
jgi:hypothetical protein